MLKLLVKNKCLMREVLEHGQKQKFLDIAAAGTGRPMHVCYVSLHVLMDLAM